jgi:hypothetical protein
MVAKDVFPEQPNVQGIEVAFKPSLFDDPHFTRRDVGLYTVIVRH